MRAVKALGATGLGVVLAVSGLSAPTAVASKVRYVPVTDELTVRGHGYGHGNGMSQYGAEGAARAGKGYRAIVRHYYPGTRLGTMRGRVRVLITADTTADVKVSPARGLSIRDLADRRTWELPTPSRIDRWRILRDGRIQFYNGNRWRRWRIPGRTDLRDGGEFFARVPIRLWVSSGSGEVARRYRGSLRSSEGDTVNVLSMDSYVRGVVASEMPASWSMEALKSQAIAARTYATWDRNSNRGRYYQTCDTTSCQVYGGVDAEHPRTNRAVRQTRREILRYQGEPAFTQFSASSGGYTADGGQPYLRAQPDPWDDWPGNYVHDWSTTIDASTLERRYPSMGRLRAIRVVERNGHGQWNGRVERIRLDGSRDDVYITGDDFRWIFGLRSNWFKIEATEIMTRWKRIGGRSSEVGRPVTGERAAPGAGSVQRFRSGRIFWHPRFGAHETYGPILREHQRRGGTESRLGYPRTGVRKAGDDGRRVTYQRGRRLYFNPPTGVHEVRHGWWKAYRRADSARGRLGLPTSDVFKVRGGQRMRFDGGFITKRDGDFRIRYRR